MANMAPSLEVVNSALQPQQDYENDPLDKTSTHSRTSDDEAVGDGVLKPGPHDVLLGRGGGTNNHCGNVKFRKLINEHKLRYLACSKVDKPKVAREVVQIWRAMEPPGRFLARKDDTVKGPGSVKAEGNVWYDVGDKKANAKASQCLRERTPDVMPYLRQLREQQDLNTEQGVRMVQQQMEMQGQPLSAQPSPRQHQQTLMANQMGGEVPMPAYSGMTSQPGLSPHMSPPGRMPMPGMQPHHQSPHMGMDVRRALPTMADMQNRRVSPGGPMQQQQQQLPQQPPFYMGDEGAGGQPQQQQQMVGQDGMYGDMTDMEYEQHMMIMQQQLQMQQMQLQRMQQQRAMQRMTMTQQQQHLSNMNHPESPRNMIRPRLGNMGSPRAGLNQSNHSNGGGATAGFPAAPNVGMMQPAGVPSSPQGRAPRRPARSQASPRAQAPSAVGRKASPRGGKRTLSSSNAAPAPSADAPPNRAVPDRTSSGFMSLGDEGELTLEEYRQQLEEYIVNNQIATNEEDHLHAGDDDDDDDDVDNESDLEDDWEKEKEKALKQNQRKPRRGVDRHKSGCSYMSIQTSKSAGGMSMVSGFSNLSDLMSTGKEGEAVNAQQERERKAVSRTVSGQSHLSFMSELTDLSQNIDNLSLYDD